MRKRGNTGLTTAIVAALAMPGVARAQRASENAVLSAEDAFGTVVGSESTGIYSEADTRGFSPTKAGNVRIDGIYMDTVQVLAGRLRESTAIRVGFSAAEYPFHAPTGIVDHRFRPYPAELGASVTFTRAAFGGYIFESDFRVPVLTDRLGLTGGIALSDTAQSDGSVNKGHGLTLRPIIRLGGVEIAPFLTRGGFRDTLARPLVVVSTADLPRFPKKRLYLGQRWARGKSDNNNAGITVKAPVTDRISLRAGLFRAEGDRTRNYTEIFSIVEPSSGLATHRLIADPSQDVESTSGEAQIAYRIAREKWQHRFIAGYRSRNRLTETGGSDLRNFGQVIYGQPNPQPEETFTFRQVNAGRVKQSALMLGYVGKLEDLGSINLGIQKARYRGSFRDGPTGRITASRDDPWLYNAVLAVNVSRTISLYAGTEKGLEDSGAAPENAVNRNEQLPATRSKQYEGGVRWRFTGGQLVVNAFQITKPYFSFDAANVFTQLGNVRHRGVETSLSGHFGKRLSVVAGAVIMQPRVTGGGRPAGTPSLYSRIDANYRTDIFGGLTPTATFTYIGKRAVRSQLMVPGYAALDLGLRQQFKIGSVPASFRAVVYNVFDEATWKVVAANTLYPDERRRFTLVLTADF